MARQLHELIKIIRSAVVEHVMGPFFGDQIAAFRGARRPDHHEAPGAGDLNGGRAHSARRSMNEDRFARHGVAAVKKRVISRRVGNAHGGSLLK